MKQTFTLLAAAILALSSGIAAAAQPTVQVRVVTPFASGHLLADTALKFKEELERRAPHMQVTVQAGVLNEQTINPAAQSCSADERVGEVVFTGGQPIQDYAPKFFFFNGPYVIRDFAHLQSVWHSDIGKRMVQLIEFNGRFVAFDPVYRGYRQFTSNKAINGPADFTNLKLRLPPTPDWIAVWSSLGVQAVQVPLTGIYAALQDGTAEASEGDLTQIQSLKLNEVQSHLTMTNHLVGFGMPLANSCFYRGLAPQDRARFDSAMRKATKWGTQTIQARESSIIADLQSKGMTVVTPNAAAIRAAAEPAINNLFATKWTVTTWAEVLAK